MELFGWLLHCVQTRLSVKIHLKTITSTARIKIWVGKDTYWIRKEYFILVLEKFFFSIFNSNNFFKLFADDSRWWIIWMAFSLCPNQTFCKNTLENHFQYCSYQKLRWKRHLLNNKSILHSRTREVVFFSIFNFNHFFKLFIDDSRWWNYLDGFCIVSKPDFL